MDLFGAPIPEPPAPKPKRAAPKPRVPQKPSLLDMELRPTHLQDESGVYLGILEWDREGDQAAHDRLPRAMRDYLNDSAIQWDAQAVERAVREYGGADLVRQYMMDLEGLLVECGSPRLLATARFAPVGRKCEEAG